MSMSRPPAPLLTAMNGGDSRGLAAPARGPSTPVVKGAAPARILVARGGAASLLGHAITDGGGAEQAGVTVRLITIVAGYYRATARDVELARRISAVAHDLGLPADPAGLQNVQITIDALVGAEVLPFWRALLGYVDRGDGDGDLIDPRGRGPLLWFQRMDAPRPQRNRMHLDIWVPYDQAEARVAAAVAAGGRLLTDEYAPAY